MIFLAFGALSCKSQTISLEQAAQCQADPNCPVNYNYVKDINNTLNKYIGIWKGTYDGRVYEIKFNKNLYDDMGMKRDRITGRLRITIPGNMPITVFDNFNEPDDAKTHFKGLGLQSHLQAYETYFVGSSPKGCINSGTIYLRISPTNPNEMKIFYWSDMDIVIGECPSTFSQTFPEKQHVTLIKQ